MAEAGRPRGHGQGQKLLGPETGLESEHGGGKLHLVGAEHAALDEGDEDSHTGRDDDRATRGPGDGMQAHATLPPTVRPSSRSLSEITSAGGTAHSNTPAGPPTVGTAGIIPRRKR